MEIVRCVSCNGYGWLEEDGTVEDCDWCGGIGYVYRDAQGIDHRISDANDPVIAAKLEALEQQRMRELGYTGEAKHPAQQEIRRRKQSK